MGNLQTTSPLTNQEIQKRTAGHHWINGIKLVNCVLRSIGDGRAEYLGVSKRGYIALQTVYIPAFQHVVGSIKCLYNKLN